MSAARQLPILCIDFDGVIHRYRDGWRDGQIYDPVTEGFFEWAKEAQKLFRLVIYSSRSSDPNQLHRMQVWMWSQYATFGDGEQANMPLFEYAAEKPPAFLTIDDRCVRFDGRWDELPPAFLRAFKPWMNREADQ